MSADPPVEAAARDADETLAEGDATDPEDGLPEEERLAGELAVLEAENEQLRTEYARLQQTQYRRSAVALAVLGALAAVGGLLFPTARAVLLALAGTGLFLGVLTYYLSPEQFLPASVGREVYGALAANERAVVDELGLSDGRLYVPVEGRVRLYVPGSTGDSLPDDDALGETFVVGEGRGVAFQPTGQALFAEFERALTGELADEPAELARQLREGLVEQFELVESTEQSVPEETTAESGELRVGVTGSAFGSVEQFDHPVPSVLGVGLARGLDEAVAVEVGDGSERVDALVTCRWPVGEDERPGAE